jgi:hypothetical protein
MDGLMMNSQFEMSTPRLHGSERVNIGTQSAKCVVVNGYWLTTV